MPTDASAVYAMAFLIGTVAMWISDLVFEAIVRRVKGPPTFGPDGTTG